MIPIIFSLMAQAAEYPWVEVWRDSQQIHYIDILSVRTIDDRRLLRRRVDLAVPLPSGSVTADYEVEINCESRTIALLEQIEWGEGADMLHHRKYRQPIHRPIEADSVEPRFFERVCEAGSAN